MTTRTLPECARLVKAGEFRVESITKDGYALAVDDAKSMSAINLAEGSSQKIQDGVFQGVSFGEIGLVWSDRENLTTQRGRLTAWTAASGAHELGTNAMTYGSDSPATDGKHIAWIGNVSDDGMTGDVLLDKPDHSAPKTLLAGVPLVDCPARVLFAGNRLIVYACPAGSTDLDDLSITSYDPETATPTTLATLGRLNSAVDVQGQHLLVILQGNRASIMSPDGTQSVPIDGRVSSGRFTRDGSALVYVGVDKAMYRVPVTGGTPTKLQAGPVLSVADLSPDGKFAIFSTQIDFQTGNVDLYLTAADGAQPAMTPVTLRQPTDSMRIGQQFTADSRFVLFFSNVDAAYNGAVWAQTTSGGAARQLADLSYGWRRLTGARVLYTNHLVEPASTDGYDPGTGDLEVVDLASDAAPVTLAAQVDAVTPTTWDGKSVVFSRRNDPAKNGIYILPLE